MRKVELKSPFYLSTINHSKGGKPWDSENPVPKFIILRNYVLRRLTYRHNICRPGHIEGISSHGFFVHSPWCAFGFLGEHFSETRNYSPQQIALLSFNIFQLKAKWERCLENWCDHSCSPRFQEFLLDELTKHCLWTIEGDLEINWLTI